MKQLIVLGNGFDLACGLKSSYADFFLQRFSELFCDGKAESFEEIEPILKKKQKEILQKLWEISNASYQKFEEDFDYFKRYSDEWCSDCNFNRWDVFFLFAQLCIGKDVKFYEWQDVESVIYEVISIALLPYFRGGSKISYKENLIIDNRRFDGRGIFEEIVKYVSQTEKNDIVGIATELLNELKKFETIFAQFIEEQFELTRDNSYINRAVDLLQDISRGSTYMQGNTKNINQIDVLSFNYSLDENFRSVIKDSRINSWSNIHGVASFKTPNAIKDKTDYNRDLGLPAPIFGVDNHDIVNETNETDLRISFTKPYRVIENNVNGIRESNGYEGVDLISIYGHSLGRADYSYFEALFDENNLYHSNCKIEYYYYPGKDEETKVIKRQEAITKMYSLLTDYGTTLSDTHGGSIVNKLNLENRLSVVPMY